MRKRLLIFWLIILIGTLVLPGGIIQGATLKELQREREVISRDIARKKEDIEQKRQEAKAINQEIQKIEGDISVTEGKIAELQSQMDEVKSQIETKVQEIRQKEQELEEQKNNQDKALRTLYETADQSLLYVLFSSNNISEVIDRTSYLEALEAKIDQAIKTITQIKEELTVQKEALKKKQDELTSLKKQQEAYKKGLQYQQGNKEDLLQETKQKQKISEKQLEEIKLHYQEIQAQISALFKKNSGKIKSKDKGTSSVGFVWPIDYDYISYGFGPTDLNYPYYPAITRHDGIDIVNRACGSPVYAAADGIVNIPSYQKYGYGNFIILGHNDRFSTLYGHLQSFAKADGDEVKQGEVIGYEGSTGLSTGCHLHFEVRDNGVAVSPINVLP